jgi:hypothetical protein
MGIVKLRTIEDENEAVDIGLGLAARNKLEKMTNILGAHFNNLR